MLGSLITTPLTNRNLWISKYNSLKQNQKIGATALLYWPPAYFGARLTAGGRHSGWAQVNWHLISSLSGSVLELNSSYQAQSLIWGEWCKVKWGWVKPEAEHKSTGQRLDQYRLSHRWTGLGWQSAGRWNLLIDQGSWILDSYTWTDISFQQWS